MEDVLVITNNSAGSNEDDALDAALTILRSAAKVTVEECSDPDHLADVLRVHDRRVVVVAGGDGSLHAVVNALHRLDRLGKVELGLVPLGTGNDFARGVGIPLDPTQAARTIIRSPSVPTDLIVDDSGTVVVNNVHLGVGAQASRAGAKWKSRLGRAGYLVGALSAGLRPRYVEVTITVDGKVLARRDDVAQVAIGNGSSVGGGTELIPGAEPVDGQLVVIVSRVRSVWTRLAYLLRLRTGTHHQMKEVSRVAGRSVAVEGEAFYLSADGELSGPHTQRCWELRPGAVRMFLPA